MRTLLLMTLLATGAWASDEHEESGGARTGPTKAVLEASAERGLKLSEKAVKRLGIRTTRLAESGQYRVSIKALVYSQEEVGIYLLRDGWYKHVDVEVAGRERDFAVIQAKGLKAGDQIVVAGAPLLRVAELDVLGGEEAGHGH